MRTEQQQSILFGYGVRVISAIAVCIPLNIGFILLLRYCWTVELLTLSVCNVITMIYLAVVGISLIVFGIAFGYNYPSYAARSGVVVSEQQRSDERQALYIGLFLGVLFIGSIIATINHDTSYIIANILPAIILFCSMQIFGYTAALLISNRLGRITADKRFSNIEVPHDDFPIPPPAQPTPGEVAVGAPIALEAVPVPPVDEGGGR
jgi:hypothetical protein